MHFDSNLVAITLVDEPLYFAAKSKIIRNTKSGAEGIDKCSRAMVRCKTSCCFET